MAISRRRKSGSSRRENVSPFDFERRSLSNIFCLLLKFFSWAMLGREFKFNRGASANAAFSRAQIAAFIPINAF